MKDFVFPFDTCETIRENALIKQPYSAAINALSASIILLFLISTDFGAKFFFFLSVFFFQFFHMFSHMFHLEGYIQTNIIHIISYFVNFTLFYLLYTMSNIAPSLIFIAFYLLLIMLDVYAFMYLSVVFFIPTQILLIVSIVLYYYQYLPNLLKENIGLFLFLILFISGLVLNEKINGKVLLENYPNFPFHIFVEITGLLFFTFFLYSFYNSKID